MKGRAFIKNYVAGAFCLACSAAPQNGAPGSSGTSPEDPVPEAPPAGGGAGGSGGAPVAAGGGAGAPVTEPAPPAPPPAGYAYDLGVGFDWPDTVPQQGTCAPGVYEGRFNCELSGGFFIFPLAFTGPVRFTLERSANGEFLEITDGLLEGDAEGILFTSELAGQLDCTTNAFEADAIDGTYTGAFANGTFTGTLEAELDRQTQTLSGTWALTAEGQAPCVGPWSATRVR
jgi:hypothetical protein